MLLEHTIKIEMVSLQALSDVNLLKPLSIGMGEGVNVLSRKP